MMKNVDDKINDVYSLPVTERHDIIMQAASEIAAILSKEKNTETIELGKRVMEKIHGIRNIMSAHRASSGKIDGNLKSAYQTGSVSISGGLDTLSINISQSEQEENLGIAYTVHLIRYFFEQFF